MRVDAERITQGLLGLQQRKARFAISAVLGQVAKRHCSTVHQAMQNQRCEYLVSNLSERVNRTVDVDAAGAVDIEKMHGHAPINLEGRAARAREAVESRRDFEFEKNAGTVVPEYTDFSAGVINLYGVGVSDFGDGVRISQCPWRGDWRASHTAEGGDRNQKAAGEVIHTDPS